MVKTAKLSWKHFSKGKNIYNTFLGKTPDSDNLLYVMSDGKVLSSDELPSLPEVSTPTPPLPIFKPTKPPKTIEEQIQKDYHPDL